MKTTKIDDSTMVLLDFSRSGASEVYDFCILVGYHFPHPFFMQILLDFCSMLGSTSRLKWMRLRIFLYIVFSIFLKSFFIKKRIFRVLENEIGGMGRDLWRAGRITHSEKSRAFVWECCIFLQTLFCRAVGKGARGKVNLTP